MIRQKSHAHTRAARHTDGSNERRVRLLLVTLVRRIALTVSALALCPANAFAVQPSPDPTIIVLPLESFNSGPVKPSAKDHASRPATARTKRRKGKAARRTGARRSNLYYRWSAEQLMLGGVNPSRIGNEASGASAKLATTSATRFRQKPRRLHHIT